MKGQPAHSDLEDRLARLARKAGPPLPEPGDLPGWRAAGAGGVAAVSQLYHGEEVTARLCASLAPRLPLAAARDCLYRQEEDEALHARLYGDWLRRQGATAPRGAVLEGLESTLKADKDAPEVTLLAVQIMLEGEALALQSTTEAWLPCPALRSLNQAIARDEARHVAFGRLYLGAALPGLSLAERRKIHARVRQLWFDAMEALRRERGLTPVLVQPAVRVWAHWRWRHWQRTLRVLGLYSQSESALFEAA